MTSMPTRHLILKRAWTRSRSTYHAPCLWLCRQARDSIQCAPQTVAMAQEFYAKCASIQAATKAKDQEEAVRMRASVLRFVRKRRRTRPHRQVDGVFAFAVALLVDGPDDSLCFIACLRCALFPIPPSFPPLRFPAYGHSDVHVAPKTRLDHSRRPLRRLWSRWMPYWKSSRCPLSRMQLPKLSGLLSNFRK